LAGLLIHTSEGSGNGLGGRRTMRLVGGIEDNLACCQNRWSLSEVHHRRGEQAQARVVMLVVVPREKLLAEGATNADFYLSPPAHRSEQCSGHRAVSRLFARDAPPPYSGRTRATKPPDANRPRW